MILNLILSAILCALPQPQTERLILNQISFSKDLNLVSLRHGGHCAGGISYVVSNTAFPYKQVMLLLFKEPALDCGIVITQ